MTCRALPLLLLLVAPLAAADPLLPECLLNYGVAPERFVLVAEKATQTLSVYSTLRPLPVATFRITSGRASGQKTEEGDQRTPEGIYFFQAMLTGAALPKADDYGERAYTMNYPNPADRLARRDGSGIWLHGAFDRDKTSSPNNSRGCIVVSNDDLPKVARYIRLRDTPIAVYDRVPMVPAEQLRRRRELLLGTLQAWRTSWESKDIDRYIGFFAPSFSQKGMNLAEFKQYKASLNHSYRYIKVWLSDVEVYQHGPTLVALFDQLYVSDVNQFNARKIQYWQETAGQPRILSEDTSPASFPSRLELEPGRLVTLEQFRTAMRQQPAVATGPATPPATLPATVPATKPLPAPTPASPPPLSQSLPDVTLSRVDTVAAAITLTIHAGAGRGLLAVPVLLQRSGTGTVYRTLDGVVLDDGVPHDFARAVAIKPGTSTLSVGRDPGLEVRSLTLFVADSAGSVRQIHTYLLGR